MRKVGKWLASGLFGFVALSFLGALTLSISDAASLSILHTAFPSADQSTEFGIPAAVENTNTVLQTNMLSKQVVVNNASNPYQVPNSTAYLIFAGTQASNVMTVSMPSATNALDNQEVTVYGQAAVSSVSFTSTGATVVGGPSAATSNNWHVKYKYDTATLSWYAVDN